MTRLLEHKPRHLQTRRREALQCDYFVSSSTNVFLKTGAFNEDQNGVTAFQAIH